jgi:hypothetical protein
MSASYAWIIGRDYLADDNLPGDTQDDKGVTGPRNAPADLISALEHPIKNGAHPFRMFDDDGELYYSGWIMFARATGPADASETAAFGPLNDFGMPNAGATEIHYRTGKDGSWEQL